MSTQIAGGAAAATPEVPRTVTVTFYQQLAEEFLKALDQLSSTLPALDGTPFATTGFVLKRNNVPIEFLGTAVVSVERIPELQSVRKLDPVAGRDTLQYIEAFRPVFDSVQAFANRLARSLQTRKASLTLEALQIYDIAKGLDRDASNPELSAAVANLKRDLGKKGRAAVPARVRKAARVAAAEATAAVIAAATSAATAPEPKPLWPADPRATAVKP